MRLSVVVPTYNRSKVLQVCLQALAAQTFPRDQFEVLVVDDGSTDDTEDVVRRFEADLPVRYLRQPTNRGRAAARNRGIREAKGEVVVFVDSDVFPVPEFLKAHAEIHERFDRAVGRGPLLITAYLDDPFGKPALRDPSLAFLDTANASVRSEHLRAVGGFDEGFRYYGWEDVDLGLRLQRLGLRRVFERRALAYHYQPSPTPDRVPELLRKEEERAQMALRLLRKHPTLSTRFLIQLTPLHALAAFLLTAGGAINERNLPALLQRFGRSRVGYLLTRAVLNRYYVNLLRRRWQNLPRTAP